MRIKFWGVRGSVPSPLTNDQYHDKLFQTLRGAADVDLGDPVAVRNYIAALDPAMGRITGGNTTCIEINAGDELIIIDCGSGLRELGKVLMTREFGRGQGLAHIFFTHGHWDHLQGFPFFAPFYVPGNTFHVYAVGRNPKDLLAHQQTAPTFFPITVDMLRATLHFHTLAPDDRTIIGSAAITSHPLHHPGGATAYRFDVNDGTFVFASDGEYKVLDDESLTSYIDFFRDADVLVFDTQYSLRDVLMAKIDWGHSSAMIGVDLAMRANVKRLYTFHHDHGDDDNRILQVAEAAQDYANLMSPDNTVAVHVSYEGLELFIGPPHPLTLHTETHDGVHMLTFGGHLTAAAVPDILPQLDTVLTERSDPRLILDFTAVTLIEVDGLLPIVNRLYDEHGLNVAYVAPTPNLRSALQETAADFVGRIFHRRQLALASQIGPAFLTLSNADLLDDFDMGDVLVAENNSTSFAATARRSGAPRVVQVMTRGSGAERLRRFTTQAEIWCTLAHPLLVGGVTVLRDPQQVIYVSERPDGESLVDWIARRGGRLSLLVALQMFEDMLNGLEAVHAAGAVHGDLHPEHVLVVNNTPLLSLAPVASGGPLPPNTYTAPEVLVGAEPTGQSDLFSLGVMWYEALVGVHPFWAELEEMVLAQQLSGSALTLRVFRPDLTSVVEDFFERMLEPDPEKRFANTREVLAALPTLMREATT